MSSICTMSMLDGIAIAIDSLLLYKVFPLTSHYLSVKLYIRYKQIIYFLHFYFIL